MTVLSSLCICLLGLGGHAHGKSIAKAPTKKKLARPAVQSIAAVAIDAKTGKVVYAKNPNSQRAIASTTKIFVAMVVRRKKLKLNDLTRITREDVNFAKGGSRTRLDLGRKFRNQDLLRAMLIASDNRAPSALGRAAGMSAKQLIREMNALAKTMGLTKTRFTDPSGLRGNTSTAKEMAIALGKAMEDEFLAEIMTTKDTTIRPATRSAKPIHYRNTNYSLHSGKYKVLGGKTGFTTPAGYCLLISAVIKGRTLHMAFLGSKEKLTRFGDFGRVAEWLATQS